MDFQELINQLDAAVKEHPELTIEQAIEQKLNELGIDEATRHRVADACAAIDGYQAEYNNLQKAKQHGINRKSWLEKRIDTLTEKFSEQEKNVILAAIINKFKKLTTWRTKN